MTFDNAISWFEIPVTDIDRAKKFYEAIFDITMQRMDMPGMKMCFFPLTDPMKGVGGTLCDSSGFHTPSEDKGPLIYLNANPEIQVMTNDYTASLSELKVKSLIFIGGIM
jgi:predicted enzyme related to lactoylglutathione lyase